MNQAGFGVRVFNYLIDIIVVFALSYLLYETEKFYAIHWRTYYFSFSQVFFFTVFLYYFLFEIIFLKSIAKFFTYTKVYDLKGKRPAFWRILVRSIVRSILFPLDPFALPFLDKTLHDYLSGTQVYED